MCCAETWVIFFPAAPDEGFGQCGETSWNHSQGSSWECGNNIKINTLVCNNLLPSEAAGKAGRSWGSLDKAGQLGIPPYCSKWLGVWHRPCTVATVHTLSHPHPLRSKRVERDWLIKEFLNPRHFLCLDPANLAKWLYASCLNACCVYLPFFFFFCWCRITLKLVLLHAC